MIPYQPPRTPESIPVVDLSGTEAGDEAACRTASWEIHKAARETGFFYVQGHGVSPSLMQAQLEWTARFFDLPLERKLSIDHRRSPNRRGYERTASQVLDDGSAPDLKESLSLGRELPPDHWLLQRGAPYEGANPWITDLPGFREQVEAYTAAMSDLGARLAGLVALSLDLPGDYFDEGLAEPSVSVRMLRYPPTVGAGADNQLGAGAHTDWGFLTLLLQDDCGGLQVRVGEDEWIVAPPIPETFVVNLGDMVPRLTGGLYKSNVHRVLNSLGGRDRHSVATFYNPHHFYRFDCASTCRTADTPDAPITFGDHIEAMIAKTYAGV